MTMTYLSVCGMLGYGYDAAGFRKAMRTPPAFIGADNGSTDPGPYYLGSGTGFVKAIQLRRDLAPALLEARAHGVPLIIGSAGGAGAQPHLQQVVDLVRTLARENNLHFRLASIAADIAPELAVDALRAGRIRPCGPVPPLEEETLRGCRRLVGQMGVGPIQNALAEGADVVIAGRSCDTAIFAALPMQHGVDPGLALHAAKIAECGALCAVPAGANDSLRVTLEEDSFVVEPIAPHRRCTPDSVAAHSLYEQPDPTGFYEPEGFVDLSACTFDPEGERGVRVRGSRLRAAATPTVKLEGAIRCGHRFITLAGIRDPLTLEHLDQIQQAVERAVAANLREVADVSSYQLHFRRYGLDAVIGQPPADSPCPAEIGLLIEAIAPTSELAATVLSLARSTALHQSYAGRKTTAGNLAFPFSPSDLDGGEVYRFGVYHLMTLDAGQENALFPVKMEEL